MRHQRATIEQAMFCCQSSQSDKVKGDSSSTTLSGKKERCTCYQMTTRKSSERERERKRVCRYLRACVKRQRERGSKCVYLKWERESQGFSATPPPPDPFEALSFASTSLNVKFLFRPNIRIQISRARNKCPVPTLTEYNFENGTVVFLNFGRFGIRTAGL